MIKLQNNETSKTCRSSWNAGYVAVYDIYSKSTCQVNCFHLAQINACNCRHHLMPRNLKLNVPVCDMQGLLCLNTNFAKISEQRKLCEECMTPCEEYDYKVTLNSTEPAAGKENSDILIDILYEIK